ncbi:MAG: alpha-L-fucosidase [Phycisphaerales bacterium]|nr:alpha-L-fucosidase [Phycisphaerales bacterium]
MLKFSIPLAAILSLSAGCASTTTHTTDAGTNKASAAAIAERDKRLAWWTDARFGMFIHWGLYAVPAGKWGDRTDHGEWIRDTGRIPVDQYDKFLADFNPVKFNADAIVLAAKNAGMKYIVITSKHHDGFALFDSKMTDWDVMSTPFKRDIMKELADACARHGIAMCWYHSIMDWHHPDYTPRRPWEKDQRPDTGADMDRYVSFMKGQLAELLTNYGPIGVLWFDGQWEGTWNDVRGRDLENYTRSLQPNIIINNRVGRGGAAWGMDEDGNMPGDYATPEQEIPASALRKVPWETCMTMNGHWGYNAADKNFKTTTDLIRKLADIASKGGNFLLNVGPTAEGEIPPESLDRLAAIGHWMKNYGESIYGTQASPYDAPLAWGCITQKQLDRHKTRLYLHVFDWPTNGDIVLPGLMNTATAVHVLSPRGISGSGTDLNGDGIADSTSIPAARGYQKCSRRGDDLIVHVSGSAPDPYDSVIALDITGAPDLSAPPVIEADSDQFVDQIPVHLTSNRTGVTIRYTNDGSDPTATSLSAEGKPVTIRRTCTLSARSFRGDQPVSPVARRTFTQVAPIPAVETTGLSDGLAFEQFNAAIKSVNELASLTPIRTGISTGFDTSSHPTHDNWAYRFRGFIHIPRDGMYRFGTRSDDGSQLRIADRLVVDNDKPHSPQDRFGHIPLAAGWHPIEVTYFENTGGHELVVTWAGPGIKKQQVPVSELKHRH